MKMHTKYAIVHSLYVFKTRAEMYVLYKVPFLFIAK